MEQRVAILETATASCPACSQQPSVSSQTALLDTTADCIAETSILSISEFADSDHDTLDSKCFYIGEEMCSSGTQTDLTTAPNDVLAYAADPVCLLQALVNNATWDLHADLQSRKQRVATLLDSWDSSSNDLQALSDNNHVVDELTSVNTEEVDQTVRLCKLRLQKLQQQWASLSQSIRVEFAASVSTDGEEEGYSLYTQDAVDLVEYIGALVCSKHTSGMWSNGLAVYDFYMESFGVSEG